MTKEIEMIRQPDIYTVQEIQSWSVDKEMETGRWVPARPMGHNVWSWTLRWKLAWKVLIGKYDALTWEFGQ
jgi:hypothetical protein